jgi:hypothetical protein
MEEWELLSLDKRQTYIIEAFGHAKNVGYNRPAFSRRLGFLSKELRDNFIKAYLAQPSNYAIFYDEWIEQPDIAEQVEKLGNLDDENKINREFMKKEKKVLYQEAIKLAKNYAEKEGVEIVGKERTEGDNLSEQDFWEKVEENFYTSYISYYDILRQIVYETYEIGDKILKYEKKLNNTVNRLRDLRIKISEDPLHPDLLDGKLEAELNSQIIKYENKLKSRKQVFEEAVKHVHTIVAAPLIEQAEELGIKNAEFLSLGNLISSIVNISSEHLRLRS